MRWAFAGKRSRHYPGRLLEIIVVVVVVVVVVAVALAVVLVVNDSNSVGRLAGTSPVTGNF